MNRSPRPGLVWLLLVVLIVGTTVEARATTTSYNITLNWPGNVTTLGQFTLTADSTNNVHYLNNWNVDTPLVGSFQSGSTPGQSGMALIPIECLTSPGCWEVQLTKPWDGTFKAVLFLYFTGSVYNYNGDPVAPTIRIGNELLVSHLDCLDPQPNVEPFNSCTGEIPPPFIPPPPIILTPEPGGLTLLAFGLFGGGLSARWRSRYRRTR